MKKHSWSHIWPSILWGQMSILRIGVSLASLQSHAAFTHAQLLVLSCSMSNWLVALLFLLRAFLLLVEFILELVLLFLFLLEMLLKLLLKFLMRLCELWILLLEAWSAFLLQKHSCLMLCSEWVEQQSLKHRLQLWTLKELSLEAPEVSCLGLNQSLSEPKLSEEQNRLQLEACLVLFLSSSRTVFVVPFFGFSKFSSQQAIPDMSDGEPDPRRILIISVI